jgi:hypothetical protein
MLFALPPLRLDSNLPQKVHFRKILAREPSALIPSHPCFLCWLLT